MTPKRIEAVQWRDDGLLAIKFSDGRISALTVSEWVDFRAVGMSLVEYRPETRRLICSRINGLTYKFEVGSSLDWSPIRERPVVYLDQNHWSTLSKVWSAPSRVRKEKERAAAVTLMNLAEAGKVILPMSAAHLRETGAWSNDAGRIALADTILMGSAGWQMRDPLEVRVAELRADLSHFSGLQRQVALDVFTLAPNAALDAAVRDGSSKVSFPAVPGEWLDSYRALVSNFTYIGCMLDQESVPRGDLSQWVSRVQNFAKWLAGETGRTKSDRRRLAYVFVSADAKKEIAKAAFAAGLSPEQMDVWIQQTWDRSSWTLAPGVSLFREVMVDKLMNGSNWESNDLTDLMYLCTASAYAGHVVGERSTIALLKQAKKRLGLPVCLHRDLASLVESLESSKNQIRTSES